MSMKSRVKKSFSLTTASQNQAPRQSRNLPSVKSSESNRNAGADQLVDAEKREFTRWVLFDPDYRNRSLESLAIVHRDLTQLVVNGHDNYGKDAEYMLSRIDELQTKLIECEITEADIDALRFSHLYADGHRAIPVGVSKITDMRSSESLQSTFPQDEQPDKSTEIMAYIFSMPDYDRERVIRSLVQYISGSKYKNLLVQECREVELRNDTRLSIIEASYIHHNLDRVLAETHISLDEGRVGRKPERIDRIRSVVLGRENDYIPLEDFATEFSSSTDNPRKTASNAISWLNRRFRELNIDLELAGHQLGKDRAYRFRYLT